MRKRIVMLIAACFLLTGCSSGVSQEEYNSLVSENSELKSDYEALQNQVNTSADNEEFKISKKYLNKIVYTLSIPESMCDFSKNFGNDIVNCQYQTFNNNGSNNARLYVDSLIPSTLPIGYASIIYSFQSSFTDTFDAMIRDQNYQNIVVLFRKSNSENFGIWLLCAGESQNEIIDCCVGFGDDIINEYDSAHTLSYVDDFVKEISETETNEIPNTITTPEVTTTLTPEVIEPITITTSKYITKTKFDKLTTGISYSEAVKIIGSEGELMSETDLGLGSEYITKMYCWYGEDGISNAVIMFQGGKLTSKSQFGL